jgi:hypothetical protein
LDQLSPKVAGKIGYQLEGGDAASVDPLENLPGVERWPAALGQGRFQLMQVDIRDVGENLGKHGVRRRAKSGLILYYRCER